MKIILCLILGLLFLSCANIGQSLSVQNKPDLVIAGVRDTIIIQGPSGGPGSPVSAGDWSAYFKVELTIRNIGTAKLSDAFYISWAENNSGHFNGHYSHSSRVNDNKRPIPVGDSIIVYVLMDVHKPGDVVEFLIESDGKPHLREPLPKIEELNYDNNTFEYIVPNTNE